MTCIAIIRNKRGKLVMAGDRRMSWGMSQAQDMPTSKVVKRDGLLIGGTGNCYLLTLINTILVVPKNGQHAPTEYIHNIFHRSVKNLLCDKGFGDDKKNLRIPPDMSLEAVIACGGHLYSLTIQSADEDNDTHTGIILIDEVSVPYATGCGGSLAWGSLLTTEDMNMPVKDRLYTALRIAAKVSPGCNDQIDIIQED